MGAQRLLVVEHEAMCPPGWMGEWLTEAGVALDVRRPYAGDPLPDGLDQHDGLVVLGGTQDAYADDAWPWLPSTRALVRRAAAEEVPTLGICLGHQLAAVALGGEVARNPRGQQIGVREVGWLPEAEQDPLAGALTGTPHASRTAVQWNNDIVTRLPDGAVALARTAHDELQAARFAPSVWGVQWHPEAGERIVGRWAEDDRDAAASRGVDVDAYVAQVAAATDELRRCWRPLAQGFARLVRGQGAAA